MKADITFGQYCEGRSPIHSLDPRMKIVTAILCIIAIFTAKSVGAFLILTVAAAILVGMTRLSPVLIIRGMKPLIFVITLTAVLNIFWISGDTPLLNIGFIHIYAEGIINAILIIIRILLLVIVTSVLLTYTTTPLALTDGLEQLLTPLRRLHVPVHEFSMMMTIALRFIPTLIDETQKIMNAQKARGANFSSGSLIERAKALIPILIPLFISAFRRADELATAMECRCYTGGDGRTRMNVLHTGISDWLFALSVILVGAAVIIANIKFPLYVLT